MAVAIGESRPRPKPVPLLSFAPEGGGDTHRDEASEKVFEYWKHAQAEVDPNHFRLPRLVVRDHTGRKIDIYSSYQDKIYAAKKNVRETGQARTPEEWRLPHGLLPANPDYTRRAPPPASKKDAKDELIPENSWFRQQPFTVDVEDVSFVAESLRCLPDVASLSYLRHEFLAGNKLFLPILKACMLHQRVLSALDRRVQQYQSPELCTGCIRSGLCYGCDKSNQPHYHMDKMAKTGGGFTYYKRDRPGNVLEKKDPRNWKTRFQEEFDKLAREIAENSNLYGVNRNQESPKVLSLIPDFSVEFAQHGTSDLASESARGSAEGKSSGEDADDDQTASETNDLPGMDQEASPHPLENAENEQSVAEGSGRDKSVVETKFELDSHEGLQGFGPQITGFHGWDSDEEDLQKGSNSDTETNTNAKHYYYQQGITKLDDLIGFGKTGLEGAGISVPKSKRESIPDGDNARASQLSREYSDNTGIDGKTSESLRSQNRGRRLYKAPPAFKVKPRQKREITIQDPFSTNRELNVPKGEGFTIKKSSKKLTEFKEFDSADKSWKEPQKFELKENSKKTTSFWKPPVKDSKERKPKQTRKVSRERAAPQPAPVPVNPVLSSDSGLESEQFTETEIEDEKKVEPEETKPVSPDVSPPPDPPVKPKRERLQKKKRGIVRKQKSSTPPKLPEIKPASPPSHVEDVSPSLTPPTPRAELSPLPPIPTFTVHELPDFVFPETPKPRSPKVRTMIENPTPVPVKENKKTRKPPPKPRRQVKVKHAKRSVAEAPVTKEELQQASDPLDFLAKYCIIHAERLPLYQKIFDKAVSNQTPRYPVGCSLPGTSRESEMDSLTPRDITVQLDTHIEGGLQNNTPHGFNPQLSPHEMKMLHDLTVINRSPDVVNVATSHAEDYLEKLKFSFEVVHEKQLKLQKQIKDLQDRRVSIMAAKAKEMFPEILSPRSMSKSKKKAKKSGKKSALSIQSKDVVFSENSSPVNGMPPPKSAASIKPELMSDAAIVEKLNNKMFDAVSASAEVCRVEVELERAEEKLNNVIGRMEELQGETALMQIYCMEYFLQSETQMMRPKEFVRQQSELYNSLHPARDVELNLCEVGPALQTINNNLLTDKELDYLFHILNLPGRTRINFQLFSVLAALSERVAQLDPLIKKLINKLDYEALDVKMEKCKELFALLHEGDYLPGGRASASLLAVELTAGGLTPEHTAYVLSKFNRDGKGIVDFMDFVTYVPLFIQIHQRIVDDPLRVELDI